MEQQELIKSEQAAIERAEAAPQSILHVIAAAARDPSVDVAKMQALLDMKMQIDRRDAEVAYKAAMAELQADMPQIQKDGKREVKGQIHGTYARYETIDRAVRPLLAKHGFSVSFDAPPCTTAGHMAVSCTVSHRAGHQETKSIELRIDTMGSKTGPQESGSTISFGRRYLLCMMLNIVPVDVDNDGAGDTLTEAQQNTIIDLIIAADVRNDGSIEKGLLQWLGVKSVAHIPQRRYEDAREALRNKAKAEHAKAGRGTS